MATTIVVEDLLLLAGWSASLGFSAYGEDRELHYPYPKFAVVRKLIINRVWDTVSGDFVRWTSDYPDTGGVLYPGPGFFGTETSNYIVEGASFTREQ